MSRTSAARKVGSASAASAQTNGATAGPARSASARARGDPAELEVVATGEQEQRPAVRGPGHPARREVDNGVGARRTVGGRLGGERVGDGERNGGAGGAGHRGQVDQQRATGRQSRRDGQVAQREQGVRGDHLRVGGQRGAPEAHAERHLVPGVPAGQVVRVTEVGGQRHQVARVRPGTVDRDEGDLALRVRRPHPPLPRHDAVPRRAVSRPRGGRRAASRAGPGRRASSAWRPGPLPPGPARGAAGAGPAAGPPATAARRRPRGRRSDRRGPAGRPGRGRRSVSPPASRPRRRRAARRPRAAAGRRRRWGTRPGPGARTLRWWRARSRIARHRPRPSTGGSSRTIRSSVTGGASSPNSAAIDDIVSTSRERTRWRTGASASSKAVRSALRKRARPASTDSSSTGSWGRSTRAAQSSASAPRSAAPAGHPRGGGGPTTGTAGDGAPADPASTGSTVVPRTSAARCRRAGARASAATTSSATVVASARARCFATTARARSWTSVRSWAKASATTSRASSGAVRPLGQLVEPAELRGDESLLRPGEHQPAHLQRRLGGECARFPGLPQRDLGVLGARSGAVAGQLPVGPARCHLLVGRRQRGEHRQVRRIRALAGVAQQDPQARVDRGAAVEQAAVAQRHDDARPGVLDGPRQDLAAVRLPGRRPAPGRRRGRAGRRAPARAAPVRPARRRRAPGRAAAAGPGRWTAGSRAPAPRRGPARTTGSAAAAIPARRAAAPRCASAHPRSRCARPRSAGSAGPAARAGRGRASTSTSGRPAVGPQRQ